MSKTGKIILWIVIAVIVVIGIWWWISAQSATPAVTVTTPASGNSNTSGAASSTPSSSYPQGNSDQSINQDMTDLSVQMDGLSLDNASVTQSMNDQPVQQAQ